MKRFLVLVLIGFMMASSASGTTVEYERLVMDLEKNRAEATLNVSELTSSEFSYSTGMDIKSVRGSDGTELDCRIQQRPLGDEVKCDTDKKKNFTVRLTFRFEGATLSNGEKTFSYTHPIYRPTERFEMEVRLPPGNGLIDDQNVSRSIFPVDGETGSDGRQILVRWNEEPSLGTLDYRIRYNTYRQEGPEVSALIGGIALLIFLSAGLLYYLRWRNRESIESVFEELPEDQKVVIEMIVDEEGEMMQKEVVEKSEYSKAKISGIVSELVDQGLVEKEKSGRSNKLKIAKNYTY